VDGTVWLWDVAAAFPRTVLATLRDNQWLAVSSDGHYMGTPGVEAELVYVVETDEGQQTLAPAAFRAKYGWNNDPTRVTRGPQ
jgi:hypothetical protein